MTGILTLEVDDKEARDLFKNLTDVDKREILDGMGYIIENSWRDEVTRQKLIDTSLYINSIHHILGNDFVLIQDNVNYGWFLERGTRAHPIPNAFGRKGFTVPHPGTKAYRPAEKGLLNARTELKKFVLDEIIKAK